MWKIVKGNLRRIIHSNIFLVLIIVSSLLFPAFLYDNSSIEKSTSESYYLGSIYTLDAIPFSHSECFLLLGGDLQAEKSTQTQLNITFNYVVFINSTASVKQQVSTENYNITANNFGDVIINNTNVHSLLLKREEGSISPPVENISLIITSYTINSYKVLSYPGSQIDNFFAFKSVSVSAQKLNFTVYYCTLPSSALGFYGNSEIFYAPVAPSSGYNVSTVKPNKASPDLHPSGQGIIGSNIMSDQVFAIANRSLLLSFNSGTSEHLWVDDEPINVSLAHSTVVSTDAPEFMSSLGRVSILFVSSVFTVAVFAFALSPEMKRRHLFLPEKRGTIFTSYIVSTIFIASVLTAAIFGFWDIYEDITSGTFYNIFTLIYITFTVDLTVFAECSILMVFAYSHRKALNIYAEIAMIGIIPLISLALSNYVYFYATSGIHYPYVSNTINYLLEPLRGIISLYNEILNLIPTFSPWQVNKWFLNTPLLDVRIDGMDGIFGLNPLYILLGSAVIPLILIITGVMLLGKHLEEAE